jgi:hypothetical protein
VEGVLECDGQVTVLGWVRCVNKQPSCQPEVGDKGRHHEEGCDGTTVSRPEKVQAGVDDVAWPRNEHDVSHPAGEDTPQDDGETEQSEEDTGKDCCFSRSHTKNQIQKNKSEKSEEEVRCRQRKDDIMQSSFSRTQGKIVCLSRYCVRRTLCEVVSVLIEHQKKVCDLCTDGWHVIRVEVLLDDAVHGEFFVQEHTGGDHEEDVGTVDGLLQDLEYNKDGGCGGVDSGTDQDQTKEGTDQSVGDNDDGITEDTPLVRSHRLGDLVCGTFRLEGFDEDPSDRDSGVDGADDRDEGKNTCCQCSTTKPLSSLLELLNLLLVDGFFIRHLHKFFLGRHGELIVCCCCLFVVMVGGMGNSKWTSFKIVHSNILNEMVDEHLVRRS